MKNAILLVPIFSLALLSGCENYTYTFNEQPVFSPSALFTDYHIPDQGLAGCVKQAIIDQKATKARELTRLNCSNAGVLQLSGLEIFTGLAHINLSDNALTEIKPLLFLPHLNTVLLSGNEALDCKDGERLREQTSNQVSLPSHCSQ